MQISDISHVKVEWMEQYANDPSVTFVLKKGKALTPREQFRYRQSGHLFLAEHENEIRYVAHDRNDHNGFGWARYKLRMVDGYDPAISGWRGCDAIQRDWGGGSGCFKKAECHYEPSDNSINLIGPWSSGPVQIKRAFGVDSMTIAVLEGDHRSSISNPKYFQKCQKRGRAYEGTALSTSCTVDFARDVIDTLAPHIELWLGDYGWTVKRRDMPPKNPRHNPEPTAYGDASPEQSAAIFA